MNTYKTIDIARIIGIHVNTVRLYETYGLIPKPERRENGYRVFTDLHIEQFRLARAALRVEIVQNGLRKQAVRIIKTAAVGDYAKALEMTNSYVTQIKKEQKNAEEAIEITQRILDDMDRAEPEISLSYTRKEAAELLEVTIDTLRNWELNGLFSVKRSQNGYRVYTAEDLKRLKIIRSLRCANYSLSSILRMLCTLSDNPEANIRIAIDTPREDDGIITACDKLLTSLREAKKNAEFVIQQIEIMKKMSEENPTLSHQTASKC